MSDKNNILYLAKRQIEDLIISLDCSGIVLCLNCPINKYCSVYYGFEEKEK